MDLSYSDEYKVLEVDLTDCEELVNFREAPERVLRVKVSCDACSEEEPKVTRTYIYDEEYERVTRERLELLSEVDELKELNRKLMEMAKSGGLPE